jgi:CitMHS family citrate-Mg2+:H+ or citrate-Ca2+:H+ symporter
MLPIQVVGEITAFIAAILIGFRIQKTHPLEINGPSDFSAQKIDFSDKPLARPKLFWVNFVLFAGCIAVLMTVKLPTFFIFMLFFSVALFVNYPDPATQRKLISKYCPTMLNPCLIFLAIGVMVGVMKESGMVGGMINALLALIPASAARYTHIIVGLVCVPILVFIPYQLFYSIFPILIGIGAAFGISSMAVLLPFVMLHGSQCSPMVAAVNLASELNETEVTEHCKTVFLPLWIACIITVIFGAVTGIMFQ